MKKVICCFALLLLALRILKMPSTNGNKVNRLNRKCQLNSLLLSLIVIGLGGASHLLADEWATPTVREYFSANGRYIVVMTPGSRDQSSKATVYQFDNGNRSIIWQSNLTNERCPVDTFISNDGEYVVTLDNWHRMGYGEDVIAFYNSTGQIKSYSFEEATSEFFSDIEKPRFTGYFSHSVSSRWWRSNSIILIDETDNSARFGIWLDWATRWFVWRLHDGKLITVDQGVKKEWDTMGREWARTQIEDGKSITESFLFLGHLKDPRDREFIEQRLTSKDYKVWRGDSVSFPIRQAADWSLAFWDGLVDNNNYNTKLRNNECFSLGKAHITVQLPHAAKKGDGQMVVLVYSEDKLSENWGTSKTECKLSKSFMYLGEGQAEMETIFDIIGMTPARYWIKAIWDKTPPYKCNLRGDDGEKVWYSVDLSDISLEPGDYDNKVVEYFEIKAGLTTEVTVEEMTPY